MREAADPDPPWCRRIGFEPVVVKPSAIRIEAADTLERQAAEIERLRAAQKVLRTSEWEFTGNERASKAFAALTGEGHD